MTKRDLDLLTYSIRYVAELATDAPLEILIRELSRRLQKENSRFDVDKFYKDCQPNQ